MNENAVDAYWKAYLETLPDDSLVRNEEYEAEGETPTRPGEKSIVLDGGGNPLCIIETAEVTVRRFDEVDEEFAREEGEGDLSLEYWRGAHRRFFGRTLPNIGRSFAEDMPLVCERFRVVYR